MTFFVKWGNLKGQVFYIHFMANLTKINFFNLIKNNRKTIMFLTSVVLTVSLLFTIVQPFYYSSSVSLLIIQNSANSMDAYTALTSSERIGDSLAQIVYTSTFFDKVMKAPGFEIDQSVFSQKESKKRDQWKKMVDTQVNRGTGILKITVYSESKDQAMAISKAIAYILTLQGWEYVGAGDINVKMVDSPLVSNWPVKPNVFINIFSGLALGFLASLVYIALTDKNFALINKPKKQATKNNNFNEKKEIKRQENVEQYNFVEQRPIIIDQPAFSSYNTEIVTMYDHLGNS